jgi:hypothetical protein
MADQISGGCEREPITQAVCTFNITPAQRFKIAVTRREERTTKLGRKTR